jgi:[citrate (pro-3S)-lyase] ligase
VLGITARFAGEEPLDLVTRQYNDAMARILPTHGIEFAEIPRCETGGGPISASRVRRLLAEGDFDAIAELVPASTLEYLRSVRKDA